MLGICHTVVIIYVGQISTVKEIMCVLGGERDTRNMLLAMNKLVGIEAKRNNGKIHFRKVVREGLPVEVISK